MIRLEFQPAVEGMRTANVPGRAFAQLRVWQPGGTASLAIGEGEAGLVILHGTFDLQANHTSWPARGARNSEFTGRPTAAFLPPRTQLSAVGAVGEMLLIETAAVPATPSTGRAALHAKPLLPLAGSGKAFDPVTGDWLPAESFPTAAELLPPRRMEQRTIGAACLERVMPADYKAATLSLDEIVLPPGSVFDASEWLPSNASEVLLFVRSEGTAACGELASSEQASSEQAWWLPSNERRYARVAARTGRCYVLVAAVGK